MADCDCLAGCPFFNDRMENMPTIAGLLKKEYCQKDFMNCARHLVKEALGKDKVPSNLFPNQSDRARILITQNN